MTRKTYDIITTIGAIFMLAMISYGIYVIVFLDFYMHFFAGSALIIFGIFVAYLSAISNSKYSKENLDNYYKKQEEKKKIQEYHKQQKMKYRQKQDNTNYVDDPTILPNGRRWNGYSDPDDFPTDGYDDSGW